MQECSIEEILIKLKNKGLRITNSRKKIVKIIFKNQEHKHIIVETFHLMLIQRGIKVSLATVYNTLHVLNGIGLLQKFKTSNYIVFDTNISKHGHLINESTGDVKDINLNDIEEILTKNQKKQVNFLISLNH